MTEAPSSVVGTVPTVVGEAAAGDVVEAARTVVAMLPTKIAMAPTVIAMVPTHQGGDLLVETLRSLAAQGYPSLRVIVSDDASTDATPDVCREFAARDARFTIVRQSVRLGWLRNSNALLDIALAHGDYAFFAPHDDLFEPSYVARMVEALQARPDAVLAFAATESFHPDGRSELMTAERTVRPASRLRRGLRYVIGEDYERWIPFRGVVRAGALRRAGPLRASRAGEYEADGRWLFRLHLLGPFVRVDEPLCRKRQHTGSLHKQWSGDRRMRIAQRCGYAREIVDADLSWWERLALLGAVAASIATWLLPVRPRKTARRALDRLAR